MSQERKNNLREIRDLLNCSDWSKVGIDEILNILECKKFLGEYYNELEKAVWEDIFIAWRKAYEGKFTSAYEGKLEFTEARILEFYRNEEKMSQEKAEEVLLYIREIGAALAMESFCSRRKSKLQQAIREMCSTHEEMDVAKKENEVIAQKETLAEENTTDMEKEKRANESTVEKNIEDIMTAKSEVIQNVGAETAETEDENMQVEDNAKTVCEAVEAEMQENIETGKCSCNQKRMVAIISAVLLLTAIISVMIVIFSRNRKTEKKQKAMKWMLQAIVWQMLD